MLLFAALVAGSFSFGSRIANDIDPTALTAVRFALSALVIGLIGRASGAMKKADIESPWRYAVLGGLMALYFVLMFEGLKTAAPVSTAAVFTLTPLLAAATGWILMRQATTRAMFGALVIGAAGALWVIFRGDLSRFLALDVGRGEAIYFAGCIAHAFYIPLVPKLNRGERLLSYGFYTMLAGAVVLTFFGLQSLLETDWASLSGTVWLVIIYLGVFASALSLSLVQYASLRLKAAKVMAYTYLVPLFVALWELVLAGALLPMAVVPGIALTCAALLALLREGASPRLAREPDRV